MRVAAWVVLALAGFLCTLFLLLPRFAHQTAVMLPRSIDRQLGISSERGMATMLQLAGEPARRCVQPAGAAALRRLMARLASAGGLAEVPEVVVLNSPIVNA